MKKILVILVFAVGFAGCSSIPKDLSSVIPDGKWKTVDAIITEERSNPVSRGNAHPA